MNNKVAISVKDLYKSFRLPHEQHSGIKQKIINNFKGVKGYENQTVLKGVNFEINKGDFFGIVGRNGSGKSTLLKLLAEIYTPDKGVVETNGSLVPFIELGVGFNPELTGRENVFLNGALLGFSRKEMTEKYKNIVEFSELDRFMDQKLKNYSSGMQVRLAFSIAIQAEGDILLLDEVLAVGDAAFQQKCFDYFATLKRNKKTVVLVTHGMGSVERFCNRAILIESGEIIESGSGKKVATAYENLFINDLNAKDNKNKRKKSGLISVDVKVLQNNVPKEAITSLEEFCLEFTINTRTDIKNLNLGVNIRNTAGVVVFSSNISHTIGTIFARAGEEYKIQLSMNNYFTNGKYYIDAIVVDEGSVGEKLLYSEAEIGHFSVMGVRYHVHSLFHPPHKFKSITKD